MPSGARLGRFLLLAVLAAGVAAAWRWRALFGPTALTGMLANAGAAPLLFIALHIAASLFFVPRTLLALGAGLVFGLWWGLLWAALGSLAGALAGFLLARYIRGGFVAGWIERADPTRLSALLRRAETGGWRMVAVLRLVPVIPHSLTNYALGLTRVRLGAYAFGSLLGQLPLTVAYADLGAAGGRALLGGADWRTQVLWPSLVGLSALALSVLVPLLVPLWARRRLRPAEPVPGA